MNARGHRGKQVVYEENEEYRRDNRALGYTSIDDGDDIDNGDNSGDRDGTS